MVRNNYLVFSTGRNGFTKIDVPPNVPIKINYNPRNPEDMDLILLTFSISGMETQIAVGDIDEISINRKNIEYVYCRNLQTSDELKERNKIFLERQKIWNRENGELIKEIQLAIKR
jgi:hypothetical protein